MKIICHLPILNIELIPFIIYILCIIFVSYLQIFILFFSLTKMLPTVRMPTRHQIITNSKQTSQTDFIPILREKGLTIYPHLLEAVLRMTMQVVQYHQQLQLMAVVLEFHIVMGQMYNKQIVLKDL